MPGHGNSPDATRALPVCADDIVHSIGPATYVGYSFGARIALHIALQHPQLCERLVLISGTAGIEDDNARAERRQDDELLGEYIQEMGMTFKSGDVRITPFETSNPKPTKFQRMAILIEFQSFPKLIVRANVELFNCTAASFPSAHEPVI
jgi:pimeloyl-ACP methyl ester carboxylesterase